jgi:hypothetical protein
MVLHFTMSRHHPFLAAHTSTEHIRTKRSVYQCKRRGQGAMQDASVVLLPWLFQNDAAEVRHELLPSSDGLGKNQNEWQRWLRQDHQTGRYQVPSKGMLDALGAKTMKNCPLRECKRPFP